jgi:transaldolase/transaldolase/glucose-6-phosphate isomerase
MRTLEQLTAHGQAVWFDYIRRSFLDSGGLQDLVDAGVRGVTSNPSIFEKAIAGSNDYDAELAQLVAAGRSPDEIYEALALEDIRRACAVLRPVYEATDAEDGYVSIEVSPALAHDTAATIAEAKRLFATLDLPNVMIKVPATPAGIPAVEALITAGINVNVTLMFSLAHYEAVAGAYLAGLEARRATGAALHRVGSVASFFVSRVDTAVDPLLAERGETELAGKIANDNAKAAYARFQQLFAGERWAALAAAGARVQRPLWASTGTKHPAYPDTLYVDELIGPHTVNTLPPATLEAFRDHGTVADTLTAGLTTSHARLARLPELGIDLGAITQKLQDDGVQAFARAFEGVMASITRRRSELLAREGTA